MRRGLLFFRFNGGVVLGIFLLFLFGAGLSGCGAAASGTRQSVPVVCTPHASNANIYRTTPEPVMWTNAFVPNGVAVTPTMSVDQQLALLEQSQLQAVASPSDIFIAFGMLVNETKTWSDIQTVELKGETEAQIVLTFISPQLIQAAYYSEVLSRSPVISSPQSALDQVAARDELIFFVSVITTTNNNITVTPSVIDIPIREMVIMNASDLRAAPLHDGHILDQPVNSSFEPVFGYLTYPIAMINGTECSWIMDPAYNKEIVITVPSISVDGTSKGPFTWVIPYSSLFNLELPQTSPGIGMFDPSQISKVPTPPGPMKSLLTPNGMEEDKFWQAYARFLWYQIMRGNN